MEVIMKVVIVEDDHKIAEEIKKEVSNILTIEESSVMILSPENAMFLLNDGDFEADIAILDIEYHIKDFNGIDIAHKINEKYAICPVIFLTEILEYCEDVYESEHCYFVLKKNRHITLKRALDKAILVLKDNKEHEYVEVVYCGEKLYIKTKDILYLKRSGQVVDMVTDSESYPIYDTINRLGKKMGQSFVRCHGSYAINLEKIRSIKGDEITMNNGEIIPIGRTKKTLFMERFLNYNVKRI